MRAQHRRIQRAWGWPLICVLLLTFTLSMVSCTGRKSVELTVVSFGVTRAAYDEIIPRFVAQWDADQHETVTVRPSYGPSGAQTRAVIDGLEADVVHLALALDMDRLAQSKLIPADWNRRFPNQSIVNHSVIALVTRPGNPEGIRSWMDLSRPGIDIIMANPKTSGGARWNFLGLWGSVLAEGGDGAQALQFTTTAYRQSPILTRDAREATDVFLKKGQGDVLVNYENEVFLARLRGQKLDFQIPETNISIDIPIAIVDRNVDARHTRAVAEAFVKFLYTPEAQREFAKVGFRSVDPEIESEFAQQFPPVENLFSVDDLGGWDQAQKEFFDANGVFDQILSEIRT